MRWKISYSPHAAGTDRGRPERCRRVVRLPSVPAAIFPTGRGCKLQPLYFLSHPLPQELQEQLFQSLIIPQFLQIRGKLFAVKRDSLGWGGETLFSGSPGFPICLKNALLLCRRRRAVEYDVLDCSLVDWSADDAAYLNKCLRCIV